MMKRQGAVISRASVLVTALVALLPGCDNPFGPSETDLQYGLNDVAMLSHGGVDLTIRYDPATLGFDGKLTNTANAVSARLVVRLSNGRTYENVFDLAAGEIHYILIATSYERFTSWSVSLSV